MKTNQQAPLHPPPAEQGPPSSSPHPDTARPEEKPSVAELRRRIRDGAYDTDAVLDAVARRILDRGDL